MKGTALISGASGALTFILSTFAFRIAFAVPTPTEVIQGLILTLSPGAVQSLIIDTFQTLAKPGLFIILVMGQLAAGAALGMLFVTLLERSGERVLPWPSQLKWGGLYGVVAWGVFQILTLPLLAGEAEIVAQGSSLGAVSLSQLASFVIYGLVLSAFCALLEKNRSVTQRIDLNTGRRSALAWLALGAIGASLGGTLWRLFASGTTTGGGKDREAMVSTSGAESRSVSLLAEGKSIPQGTLVTQGIAPERLSGMPMEVTPNEEFYLVSKNFIDPEVSEATWSLKIEGLVAKPIELTYDELRSLPSVEQYTTLTCISNEIGGDLISNALWKGVPLRDLLVRAGLKPEAKDIALSAADGYSESFPVAKALEPSTIVAYEMNGVPLPSKHGFPARLIVPGLYGIKNVKWLTRIEPVAEDFQGFWQRRGWTDIGIINTSSRIDAPIKRTVSSGRPTPLGGIAFAGDRGILRVEVSFDNGSTWHEAAVKGSLSPYGWALWGLEWVPAQPGNHKVLVRATDKHRATQSSRGRPPFPDGATGLHDVRIKVVSI